MAQNEPTREQYVDAARRLFGVNFLDRLSEKELLRRILREHFTGLQQVIEGSGGSNGQVPIVSEDRFFLSALVLLHLEDASFPRSSLLSLTQVKRWAANIAIDYPMGLRREALDTVPG